MKRITLALVALCFMSAPGFSQIVSHPTGCPRTLFCGCGAAVKVFNQPRRDLWKASSWLKFPRATPAPGMVAANHRHVMVLQQQTSRGTWIVYDANSGEASYYWQGQATASGERFRPDGLTAAHRSLPFGTKLLVTYRGKSVVVRINDRGPFIRGRVLDLSRGAARAIGLTAAGVAHVTFSVVN